MLPKTAHVNIVYNLHIVLKHTVFNTIVYYSTRHFLAHHTQNAAEGGGEGSVGKNLEITRVNIAKTKKEHRGLTNETCVRC